MPNSVHVMCAARAIFRMRVAPGPEGKEEANYNTLATGLQMPNKNGGFEHILPIRDPLPFKMKIRAFDGLLPMGFEGTSRPPHRNYYIYRVLLRHPLGL